MSMPSIWDVSPSEEAFTKMPRILTRNECTCEKPFIKCDHLGCNCVLCGGMERLPREPKPVKAGLDLASSDDSSMTVIVVTRGPRHGIYFKNDADYRKFATLLENHPAVVHVKSGEVPFTGLPLRVATPEEWEMFNRKET